MSEQNKEIVRKALAALGQGDMEGFVADAADDFSFTLIGNTPLSGTIQGKQTVQEGLQNILGPRLATPGIEMEIESLIAEGNFVSEQSKGTARTKAGKDYNNTYSRVWKIVDGKVQACTEYLDTELVRNALCD